MALNKTLLTTQIKGLFSDALEKTGDQDQAIQEVADQLAGIIDGYIKSATITIPSGTINVVGPGGASTNPAPVTTAIIT